VPSLFRRSINAALVLSLALAAFVGFSASPTSTNQAQASTLTFGQRAVQIASYQRGKPYRYGAAGPRAFDCSGLVMYVFARLGKHLAHNAEEQYFETAHIRHRSMRVGDLIFFTSNGRASGIYHVAIYAGGHYMWAAPHTGTVVHKQRIYSSHYLSGRVRR
jgi:cell wall-associated NlpC family hydrolase